MAKQRSKTALVLAGGGILGAAYEIGCLTALDKLFAPGFSSRRFDMYIGISAGSVIATLMANRIRPARLFGTISRNIFERHGITTRKEQLDHALPDGQAQ